jgi:hypothetical protein
MRHHLEDNRLPETTFPPTSDSLESEFESLLARIDEIRKQIGEWAVAAEEAATGAQTMRNDENIAVREARR